MELLQVGIIFHISKQEIKKVKLKINPKFIGINSMIHL